MASPPQAAAAVSVVRIAPPGPGCSSQTSVIATFPVASHQPMLSDGTPSKSLLVTEGPTIGSAFMTSGTRQQQQSNKNIPHAAAAEVSESDGADCGGCTGGENPSKRRLGNMNNQSTVSDGGAAAAPGDGGGGGGLLLAEGDKGSTTPSGPKARSLFTNSTVAEGNGGVHQLAVSADRTLAEERMDRCKRCQREMEADRAKGDESGRDSDGDDDEHMGLNR